MFQFLILFLKVVVLVRIAVRELIDLNFSVRQLLPIGIKKQSGKCNSLYPILAFMIFSFFFLTSDFVRQSAFARTGMRFTQHLHYQRGNLYSMLLHYQLSKLTFFCIISSPLCVLCFSHFILQPSQELQVKRLEAVAIRRDEVKTTVYPAINLQAFKIDKNGFNTLISFDNEHSNNSNVIHICAQLVQI